MEQHSEKRRVQELIEEYNRQLMDTYRQQPKAPPTPKTSWLDEQYPLPDIKRDRAVLAAATTPTEQTPPTEQAPSAEQTPPAEPTTPPSEDTPQFPYTDEDLNGEVPRGDDTPAPPEIGASPYVGYLRVFVFTGQSAKPLQGATVAVTREQGERDELYATATTDGDGFTPILPLPSVNPALTMRPDIPSPYIAYDIRVDALGFQPVIYENVPIYGNNYVTQSASMLPLVAGQDPTVPRIFRSGAPINL